MNNEPEKLLITKRSGFIDRCFWGSVYLADKKGIYKYLGLNPDEIAFMRSLAKPLQCAIIADCRIVKDYKLNKGDIALFCGSHAGSPLHAAKLKKLLIRHNLKVNDLLLEAQEPLDRRSYMKRKSKLYNNCSAKHIMMLLMSKYLNCSIKNYTDITHPVQKLIKEKQIELSGYKNPVLTYDGCSAPLWGLPVENIIEAYFNFFHSKKYALIIDSILKNSYLYGGFERFDSEIISNSKGKLFAKVGAGGFVLVYNCEIDKILLVKLAHDNNEARKLITLDILSKLNWLKSPVPEWELNQANQKVAKYCYKFQI